MTDCFEVKDCESYDEESHICSEGDGDSLGVREVCFFIDIISCSEDAHDRNCGPTQSKVGI